MDEYKFDFYKWLKKFQNYKNSTVTSYSMWDDLKKDYDICLENLKIIKSKYKHLLVKIYDLRLKKMPMEINNTNASKTINIVYKLDQQKKPDRIELNTSPKSELNTSPPPVLNTSPPPLLITSPPPGLNISPTPGLNISPTPGLNISPTPRLNILPPPGLNILPPPGLNILPTPDILSSGLPIFESNKNNEKSIASPSFNDRLFSPLSNNVSLLGLSYDSPSRNKYLIELGSNNDLSFESELLRNNYQKPLPSMQYSKLVSNMQEQVPSMQYQQSESSMQYQQQPVLNIQQVTSIQYQQSESRMQYQQQPVHIIQQQPSHNIQPQPSHNIQQQASSMQYQQQMHNIQQPVSSMQYQQQPMHNIQHPISNIQYQQPVSNIGINDYNNQQNIYNDMKGKHLNLNAPSFDPVIQPITIGSFQEELSKLDPSQLEFLLNKIKEVRDQNYKSYIPSNT